MHPLLWVALAVALGRDIVVLTPEGGCTLYPRDPQPWTWDVLVTHERHEDVRHTVSPLDCPYIACGPILHRAVVERATLLLWLSPSSFVCSRPARTGTRDPRKLYWAALDAHIPIKSTSWPAYVFRPVR